VRIRQFMLEGLGHLSSLIADDEAGVAAVVDPRRDVDVYLEAAASTSARPASTTPVTCRAHGT
jgi:hydroxyacylglutathione hydrolase